MTTLLREPLTAEKPSAPPQPQEASAPSAQPDRPVRLASLDAYRGFIMLAMASSGLALSQGAEVYPDVSWLQFLGFHTDHVAWVGCSFWDLIQPSFMFMVGIALPFSYAARKAKGDSDGGILRHTIWRALLLVLLGVFLASPGQKQTNWIFTNVLAQIGLGYVFVYLLLGRGLLVQFAALAALLAGYWLAFLVWPLPLQSFDYSKVGLPTDWQHLTGWFAHWDKNANLASAFDDWFLNLFPRDNPFVFNEGGYTTLNFVPSMATMLLGLMAGELLRRPLEGRRKFELLVTAGSICLALGILAGWTVCPIVKRIWTPSWVLYSAGWTFWFLAAFYAVIDLGGHRRWAFPLIVVGMNSIAIYMMSQLSRGFIGSSLRTHAGWRWVGEPFAPTVQTAATLVVLWLVCWWMYRRKIFLKI
jgi:heparan-alpha-glucosaminide N-acetyltransferase